MRLNYIDNCDCLVGLRDLPDKSVDLVVTDPPYRLTSGGANNMGGILAKPKEAPDVGRLVRQGKIFKHNDIAFDDWIPEIGRVLKDGTHCYIMVNSRNLLDLWLACERAGLVYQNLLIWDKGNVTPSRYYMNACELVLLLRKGKARTINNPGEKNIIRVRNPVGEKKHPTEKPVELLQVFIENSSQAGEVVLDPFMGSGSTAAACIRIARNFIGFELDEKYHDVAQQRIADEIDRLLAEEVTP